MLQNPDVLLIFDKVHNPLRLPREATSEPPKVLRTCQFFFNSLTSTCASRRNGVHFTSQLPKVVRTWCVLYILTSKCPSRHNGVHFFDISTSKSGPDLVCFVHFDFETSFAPQRRALFHLSSDQLAPHPPLYRAYFSNFWGHKSLEKHSVLRLSYLFAHLHLLSSDFSLLRLSLLIVLFSLPLPYSAFHLSILSEV